MTPNRTRPVRDEAGVTIMLVALGMTMLMTIAAVVIDLGAAYVTAREMQNASDAAAMAGAHTLDGMHLAAATPTTTAAKVDAVVAQTAKRNGADPALVTCTLITWNATPLGPCTSAAAAPLADGVLVSSGFINKAVFATTFGVDHMRLDRKAAATIQPLVGQDAPLLVCAFGQLGTPPPPDLLLPVIPLLPGGPAYRVNPLAVSPDNGLTGPLYKAHAPQVADCGLQGNSFKGNAGAGPFILPDWLPIATGVKAGPIRAQIADQPGCGTLYPLGCVLALPICSGSNGAAGINGQMFCNLFGAFKLITATANVQQFRLLGAAEGIVGIGGSGSAGTYDVRMIRLIM